MEENLFGALTQKMLTNNSANTNLSAVNIDNINGTIAALKQADDTKLNNIGNALNSLNKNIGQITDSCKNASNALKGLDNIGIDSQNVDKLFKEDKAKNYAVRLKEITQLYKELSNIDINKENFKDETEDVKKLYEYLKQAVEAGERFSDALGKINIISKSFRDISSDLSSISSEFNRAFESSKKFATFGESNNIRKGLNDVKNSISEVRTQLSDLSVDELLDKNFKFTGLENFKSNANKVLEEIKNSIGISGNTNFLDQAAMAQMTANQANEMKAILEDRLKNGDLSKAPEEVKDKVKEIILSLGEGLSEKLDDIKKITLDTLKNFDASNIQLPNFEEINNNIKQGIGNLDKNAGYMALQMAMGKGPFNEKDIIGQKQRAAAYSGFSTISDKLKTSIEKNEIETGTSKQVEEFLNLTKVSDKTFKLAKSESVDSYSQELKKNAQDEMNARKQILQNLLSQLQIISIATGSKEFESAIENITGELKDLDKALGNSAKSTNETVNNIQKVTNDAIGEIKSAISAMGAIRQAWTHFETNEAERRFYNITSGGAGLGYSQQLVFLQDLMNRTNQGIANYMGISGIDYQSLWKNAIEYAKLEEKQIYQGTRTTAARGFNDLSAEDIRNFGIDKANELYKISKGQIGFNELTENFDKVSGLGMRSGKDAQQFAEYITLAKNAYELSEGTATSAIQTLYKDMGLTVDQTVNAMEKMNSLAKLSGTPMEQYVSVLQKIASQYREIGLSAEDAQNVITNLTEAGFNIKDVDSIASQFGSAIAKFSQSPTQVIMGGLLQGQIDPFKMLFESQHVTGGNWGEQMANSMDAMLKFNRNMFGNGYMGDYRTLKQLQEFGFSQRNASLIFDKLRSGEITSLESLLNSGEYKTEDQVQESIDDNIANLRKTVEGIADSMGIIIEKQSEVDLQAKENAPGQEEFVKEQEKNLINPRLKDANTEYKQALGMVNSFFGSDEFSAEFSKRFETAGEAEAAQASDNLWQADIKNISSVLDGIQGLVATIAIGLNAIGVNAGVDMAGAIGGLAGGGGALAGVLATGAITTLAAAGLYFAVDGTVKEITENQANAKAIDSSEKNWGTYYNKDDKNKITKGQVARYIVESGIGDKEDFDITHVQHANYEFGSKSGSEFINNGKVKNAFEKYIEDLRDKHILDTNKSSEELLKSSNIEFIYDSSSGLKMNISGNEGNEDFDIYVDPNTDLFNAILGTDYNKNKSAFKKMSTKEMANNPKTKAEKYKAELEKKKYIIENMPPELLKSMGYTKTDSNGELAYDFGNDTEALTQFIKENELYLQEDDFVKKYLNDNAFYNSGHGTKNQLSGISSQAKRVDLENKLKNKDISQSNLEFFKQYGLTYQDKDSNYKLQDNLNNSLKNLNDAQLQYINALLESDKLSEDLSKAEKTRFDNLIDSQKSLKESEEDLQKVISDFAREGIKVNLLGSLGLDTDNNTPSNIPGYDTRMYKSDTELEQHFNESVKNKTMDQIWELYSKLNNGAGLSEDAYFTGTSEETKKLFGQYEVNGTLLGNDDTNNLSRRIKMMGDAGQGYIINDRDKSIRIISTGNKNENNEDLYMVKNGNQYENMTFQALEELTNNLTKDATITTIKDKLTDLLHTAESIDNQMPEPGPDDNAFSGYLANGQLMLSNEAFHNSSYLNHVTDSSMDWEQLRNDMEFMGGNFSNSAVDNQAASRAMAERTGNTTYLTSSIDNVSVNGNRGYGTNDRKALDIYVYASDSFDVQTKEAINKAPASAYARHVSTQWNTQ